MITMPVRLSARSLVHLTLAIFPLACTVEAQPAWQWARHGAASSDNVYGYSIAADQQGNTYVVGKFGGQTTFVEPGITLTSAGDSDAYLAKYDSQGALQWVKRFGGAGTDTANAVAVDDNGFIYVAGRYAGPAAFDAFTLTNIASGFVLRVDPTTTNVLWAREAGLEWFGVACDQSGNSYAVGQPAGFQLAGAKLAGPIALVKYDAAGTRLWYTNCLAPNLSTSGSGRAITVDSNGNAYITGIFRRVIEFGATSLSNSPSPNNVYDEIFVAKFSPSGVPLWAKRGGGQGNDQGLAIGVDGAGNAVVSGYCDNTTALNSGTSVPCDIGGFTFPDELGGGLGNVIIAKFTTAGDGVWARKLSAPSLARGIAVLPSGDFYLTGIYRSSPLDFGGVTLSKFAIEEVFVVKYNANANAEWGRASSTSLSALRRGIAVAAGPQGAVFHTGEYNNFPEFDGATLPGAGSRVSMFVAKLAAQVTATPPRIDGLTLLGGGNVRLTLSPGSSQTYIAEAASDLPLWSPVSTNQAVGGTIEFSDPGSAGAPHRFYRFREQ